MAAHSAVTGCTSQVLVKISRTKQVFRLPSCFLGLVCQWCLSGFPPCWMSQPTCLGCVKRGMCNKFLASRSRTRVGDVISGGLWPGMSDLYRYMFIEENRVRVTSWKRFRTVPNGQKRFPRHRVVKFWAHKGFKLPIVSYVQACVWEGPQQQKAKAFVAEVAPADPRVAGIFRDCR